MSHPAEPAELEVHDYQDATVYPMRLSPDVPNIGRIGVFDTVGEVIASTIGDRHHGTHTFVAAIPGDYPTPTTRNGEAIYAGAYYEHFGHFLLECHQRLWWAKDRPDLPIVWVAQDNWTSVRPLRR